MFSESWEKAFWQCPIFIKKVTGAEGLQGKIKNFIRSEDI